MSASGRAGDDTGDLPVVEVSVTEVLRRPGERRRVQRVLDLPRLAVATVEVEPGAPVDVDVTAESTRDGVLVEGTISAPWVGECRRCLEPVAGRLDVPVRELYEPRPTPGDSYPLVEERIDLVPLAVDAILLALPLAPLCREDCRGPDPERFPAEPEPDAPEAEADAEPAGPPPDPRWAGLAGLRFDPPGDGAADG